METVEIAQKQAIVSLPTDRKWFEAMPGEVVAVRVKGEDTGGAYAIVEGILPPLSGPPMHIHENEDEIFHILDGTLRFSCEGEVFDASAGSYVVIPKGASHTWKNVSEKHVRAAITLTPAGMEGMFAEFTGATPQEAEEIAQRYGCKFVGPPL